MSPIGFTFHLYTVFYSVSSIQDVYGGEGEFFLFLLSSFVENRLCDTNLFFGPSSLRVSIEVSRA